MTPSQTFTAFDGHICLGSGPLADIALRVKNASGSVSIFDDFGRAIDIDTRGTDEQIVARLAPDVTPGLPEPNGDTRGRGRPKLGVIAREVTLLPRHWDWLNSQPGGASVALRRLVDDARRTSGDRDRTRAAQEAAYRFMSAIAGNLPGFEEAARALFANDRRKFGERIAAWPPDVRDHAIHLAFADLDPEKV